jgi:Domain of unknown function (DUF4158)
MSTGEYNREHRREICRVDGWREFARIREELSGWIDHRAWTTGSGPKTVFDGVTAWLRRRQVLLPAVRELEKLVSWVVRAAHVRPWNTMAELMIARQAKPLLDLVEVPGDRRFAALKVLRRGPVDHTGKALCSCGGGETWCSAPSWCSPRLATCWRCGDCISRALVPAGRTAARFAGCRCSSSPPPQASGLTHRRCPVRTWCWPPPYPCR